MAAYEQELEKDEQASGPVSRFTSNAVTAMTSAQWGITRGPGSPPNLKNRQSERYPALDPKNTTIQWSLCV